MNKTKSVAVIGAGMSGLSAAVRLTKAGLNCTVFEKSRGIGGRMLSRRIEGEYGFDHGAQYFTARSQPFRDFLRVGLESGAIKPWHPSGSSNVKDAEMYVGAPSMNQPVKSLAAHLDVRLNIQISDIQRTTEAWRINGNGLTHPLEFDYVVLSVPAPQARDLTRFSPKLQAELESVHMEPCWAVMVELQQASTCEADVIRPADGPIEWLAHNNSKPGRAVTPERWVAHANADWSKSHLEYTSEDVIEELWPEIARILEIKGLELPTLTAHRWRYARVSHPANSHYLEDESGTCLAVGDWCLGPRVECAFETGLRAAEYIKAKL